MPRTAIAAQPAPGGYPTLPVGANSLDLAMTAADVGNKNQTPHTGRELLIAQNTDPTNPYTFTVTSVADDKKRTGDVGPYTLQAGELAFFGPVPVDGWRQADGNLQFEANNAAIKFAVIRVP